MDHGYQLEALVRQRTGIAASISKVLSLLEALQAQLKSVVEARQVILQQLSDPPSSQTEEIAASLRSVKFEHMQDEAVQLTATLHRIARRFSRSTINIGVLGQARQGKSTLLQIISGLDELAIPTSPGLHCTGAKSLIVHADVAEPYAEVSFYSEDEFLRAVIWPYFSFRGGSLNLGPPPITLEGFVKRRPVAAKAVDTAEYSAYITRIQKYFDNLPLYRQWLTGNTKRVPLGELREFIAQRSLNGETEYFAHLAVKQAIVYSRFPRRDVSRLGLIDLRGLGDYTVNDAEVLRTTLADDVDFVIFLKLPANTGTAITVEDVKAYDIAADAIPELPLSTWSIYVLNKTPHNQIQCESCVLAFSESTISVLDTKIVDCKNVQDVDATLIDFALTYLTANLHSLDAQYCAVVQREVVRSVRGWLTVLETAKLALGGTTVDPTGDEYIRVSKLFRNVYQSLIVGLREIIKRHRDAFSKPVPLIASSVARVIQNAKFGTTSASPIPDVAAIERQRALMNGWNPALEYYVEQLRARITGEFSSLDVDFERFMESVKTQVAELFKTTGQLTMSEFSALSGTPYLAQLLNEISRLSPPPDDPVRAGLTTLIDARLSYRGIAQHRIRRILNRLTPDEATRFVRRRDIDAIQVRSALDTLYGICIEEIEDYFRKWSHEPTEVAFALLEEFEDQAFRSERAESTWLQLYVRMRASVWRSEFDILAGKTRLQQEWAAALKALDTILQSRLWNFSTLSQEVRS